MGLSDTVRTRIEEAGAVLLDEAGACSLSTMKNRHVYAIMFAVIGSLLAVVGTEKFGYILSLPVVVFGVVAVVEATEVSKDTAMGRPKRVARAVAQWFGGAICFALLTVLAFIAGVYLQGGYI